MLFGDGQKLIECNEDGKTIRQIENIPKYGCVEFCSNNEFCISAGKKLFLFNQQHQTKEVSVFDDTRFKIRKTKFDFTNNFIHVLFDSYVIQIGNDVFPIQNIASFDVRNFKKSVVSLTNGSFDCNLGFYFQNPCCFDETNFSISFIGGQNYF